MTNNQLQNRQAGTVTQQAQNRMKDLLNGELRGLFKNTLNDKAGSFMASLIDLYADPQGSLKGCDANDVAMEALKAATLNLPINKNLGYAYIVPYKNKPTLTIGYKGLIQLAMRSGQYVNLNAGTIYEGMKLENNYLTGTFNIGGEPISDNVLGYFAYFKLVNGFEKALYMSKEEMEAYMEEYSPSYKSSYSPWKNEFDKMGQKTVMRQLLSKYGILSTEMQQVINDDVDREVQESIILEANQEPIDFPSNVDLETGEILDGVEYEVQEDNNIKGQTQIPGTEPQKAPF